MESDEALLSKIEALLETVDAEKELSRDIESTITIAELSGTKLSERYRKLAILMHRKLVTTEECRRVASIDAKALATKQASWDSFFQLRAENDSEDELILDRDASEPQIRDPL